MAKKVDGNMEAAAQPLTAEQAGGATNAKDAANAEKTYSKQQAGFVEDGGTGEIRCGNCKFFEGGTCDIVEGTMTPEDVSKLFEPLPSEGKMSSDLAMISQSAKTRTMFINRVSHNRQTGQKFWYATASGTELDKYQERMTVPLYRDFINRIEEREPVPPPFSSDFWNGGLPYLSVAHYLDLEGAGIAGYAEKVWIDGDTLKARGVFEDTPIGNATFEAIQRDIQEDVPDAERVRISIAFLDYGHDHEGAGSFERKSLTEKCQYCDNGVMGKAYTKGLLIHLAATRIPAYEQTSIDVVERAMSTQEKNPRQQDAASIVGDDLAQELEEKQRVLVGRSGAEASDAVVIKAEDKEDYEADEKKKKDEEEAEVEEKAKAEEPAESEEPEKSEEEEDEKADEEEDEEEMSEKSAVALKSLGGAMNLDAADAFLGQNRDAVVTPEDVLGKVLRNIVKVDDAQAALIDKAIADYQGRIDIQALKAIEKMEAVFERGIPEVAEVAKSFVPDGHFLQPAIEGLVKRVDEACATEGLEAQEKYAVIEEAYEELAVQIRNAVEGKEETPASVAAEVKRAVAEVVQPLHKEIAQLKAKIGQQNLQPAQTPVRRSVQPAPMTPITPQTRSDAGKTRPGFNSVADIARKSVGIKN